MKTGQKIVYSSIFMLISPLFTLVQVLRSRNRSYLRWMLTIFATIYASTFSIEGIGDGTRHWRRVYNYYVDLPFAQFRSDLADILLFRTNYFVNEDVYIHVLSYFTGNVIGAPGLFFVFVGFIYGYFFAASMVRIFDHFPSMQKHFPYFIIAVYFIAILNLQSMNTVRTWTGFWILFYATIQYHDTRRLKYLFLLLSAPIFHVGYFLMALPTWAVVFLPLKKYWISVVYVASFAFSLITPQLVVNRLQLLEVGQEKIKSYYVEEKASVEDRVAQFSANGSRWYRVYKKSGILEWVTVCIALVFLFNGDFFYRMNSLESLLFSAGLASKILSNVAWFIFAVSNRSATIADLFVLAAIILYWQRYHKAGKKLNLHPLLRPVLYLSVLFIIPGFFFYISNNLEFLSVYLLFFPEIAWINEELRITFRGLIGKLIGL